MTPHALSYFKKELSIIQDSNLQGLFYNALSVAPESFHEDKELLLHVKKAFHILHGSLKAKNVQGAVKEALLGTVLICDIMLNEFEEDLSNLHGVAVRSYLEKKQVHKDVQQGLWENIMRAVEGHSGDNGASPMLSAKPGTAEYEVYNAFLIANMEFIEINWESIFKEEDE